MKNKNAIRIVLIVLFLVIAATAGFLTVQELVRMQKYASDISYIQKAVAEQHLVLKQKQEEKKKSSLLEQQNEALQAMIPQKPMQDHALAQIQDKAAAASASLENVEFFKQKAESKHVEMPLKIGIKSNYQSFLSFLAELMYDQRLIRVDEIQIKREEDGLSIELLCSYFYGDS
jgi:Tfp pilus assembly protein PilO